MKKTKKILALALAAVMLVSATVAVTVAYLTSTDSVTNTFTVGKVKITLDELPVDPYGVPSTSEVVNGKTVWTPIPTEDLEDFEDRVKANTYKLIPGHTYVKDPTVHVQANSEECYVFIKVANGIEDIVVAGEEDDTIEEQILANWNVVDEDEGIYVYNDTVPTSTTVTNLVVFESFTVADDAVLTDATGNPLYSAETPVTVQAYAIQADGFDIAVDTDLAAMLEALGL